MSKQPETPMPPHSGLPAIQHWPRIVWFGLRAAAELARARHELKSITIPAIKMRNLEAKFRSENIPATSQSSRRCAWIAYALPRVGRRCPFRADCLVQALAGQRWLASYRIPSEIVIGAEIPEGKPFAAHAWLVSNGEVVTGGDIAHYTVLV